MSAFLIYLQYILLIKKRCKLKVKIKKAAFFRDTFKKWKMNLKLVSRNEISVQLFFLLKRLCNYCRLEIPTLLIFVGHLCIIFIDSSAGFKH